MDEPGSAWLLNKGVLVCRWLRGCGLQREQQMDGDVAGTGAPCLPAAIRHALMIMSHLLPGQQASSAALSSNTGSTTPNPLFTAISCNACGQAVPQSFLPPILHVFLHLPSTRFTFRAPVDHFLVSLHPPLAFVLFPLSPLLLLSSRPSTCTNTLPCPGLMGSATSQLCTFVLLNCDD